MQIVTPAGSAAIVQRGPDAAHPLATKSAGTKLPPRMNGDHAVPADVQQAVKTADSEAKRSGSDIRFSYSDVLGQLVVQVVDNTSGEVIGQIPSREFIAAVAAARKTADVTGLILNKAG